MLLVCSPLRVQGLEMSDRAFSTFHIKTLRSSPPKKSGALLGVFQDIISFQYLVKEFIIIKHFFMTTG